MKRILLGCIALVAFLGFVGFLYYQSKSNARSPEQKLSVVAEYAILLYPERGDVSFKATPNSIFQQATTSPTIIPNQSIVHTGTGKASVLLPDNSSISLDNNTEITVNYTPQAISMYQSLGITYHRVEELITGKTYQVETAGTLAAVRGTKFAVKYDPKTKKTKIAVTENKVEVSSIPKTVGTTTIPAQLVVVEEGKTVSVEVKEDALLGIPTLLTVIDTNKDPEMKAVVEAEKKIDIELDRLKKENSNMEEFRKEIKRVLFDDTGSDSPKEIEQETERGVPNVEAVERDAVIKTEVITKPVSIVEVNEVETPIVVTKVGQAEFFSAFEPMFIKYFYLDEVDTPCSVTATPEERVRIVTTYAQSKGYPFTKPTLSSFAVALDSYCHIKDTTTKQRLQIRFDEEYPF